MKLSLYGNARSTCGILMRGTFVAEVLKVGQHVFRRTHVQDPSSTSEQNDIIEHGEDIVSTRKYLN
jgi:hypothetical protein